MPPPICSIRLCLTPVYFEPVSRNEDHHRAILCDRGGRHSRASGQRRASEQSLVRAGGQIAIGRTSRSSRCPPNLHHHQRRERVFRQGARMVRSEVINRGVYSTRESYRPLDGAVSTGRGKIRAMPRKYVLPPPSTTRRSPTGIEGIDETHTARLGMTTAWARPRRAILSEIPAAKAQRDGDNSIADDEWTIRCNTWPNLL